MEVEALLSDSQDRVLVLVDGTALLVDWYDWSNKPLSIVEFRFGGIWTRVECEVQSFVCNMGRDLTFESVEAGHARISLDNRAGEFTNFVNGRPPISESTEVRLRLRHPTLDPDNVVGEQVLWHGRVANWEQEWTFATDVVVVDAVDVVALLNEQGGALGWVAGELGDAPAQRLDRLVQRVGLNKLNRYFDQGTTQLTNPRLHLDTVLDAAFTVALTDGGHFFAEVDATGMPSLVYLDRNRLGRPPINIPGYAPPAGTTVTPPSRRSPLTPRGGIGATNTEVVGGNVHPANITGSADVLADVSNYKLNSLGLPIRINMNADGSNMTIDQPALAFARTIRASLPANTLVIVDPIPWIGGGTVDPMMFVPSNKVQWFADWERAVIAIANAFPDAYGVYVNALFNMLEVETARWTTLIRNVRFNTDAKLVFRTDWWITDHDDPATITAFETKISNTVFAEPDAIAICSWFELTSEPAPTVDQIKDALRSTTVEDRQQDVYDEVRQFTIRWDKPIMFCELNCPALDGGATEPWNPVVSTTANASIQANFLQAYWETFSEELWWVGFAVSWVGLPASNVYELSPAAVTALNNISDEAGVFLPQDTSPPVRFYGRPGQDIIPRFSDRCDPELASSSLTDGLPYTDLVWSYRGWEMPSLVAVSNEAAPSEKNPDGEELPPAWPEVGHIGLGQGRRHNIIEYTRLQFYKQADADALANLYAHVLSRARFDVSVLEVMPELDERLWDVVTRLRQGDWVYIERHLQTDRLLAKCSIEGIEFSLDPSGTAGDGPRWRVTYRLTSMSVDATDIPPEELPPRPPGFPNLKPPLPVTPSDITIADFGQEAQPGLGPTTFVERGTPYYVFELSMIDVTHPVIHQAFAYSDEFGRVELPLRIARDYVGDGIRRQFGGVMLGPGAWIVYAVDGSRQSNQIVVEIPQWAPIVIVNDEWIPHGVARFRYTDGRYPAVKPRIFVHGKSGDIELRVNDWTKIGDPATTSTFEVEYVTYQLVPDEYDVWIQDPNDNRRQSDKVTHIKETPIPGLARLAPFDAEDWDEKRWDQVGIEWDPVPGAERYIIEYRELGAAEFTSRSEVAPFTQLRGGNSTSTNGQVERVYEVRIACVVNRQEGPFSASSFFETGYPYLILKTDWSLAGPGGTYSRDDRFGVNVSSPRGPSWTQSVNPDADLFVGIEGTKLTFFNMRTFLRLDSWNPAVYYAQGDFTSWHEEDDPNIWHVYRAEEGAAPPGSPAPEETNAVWKRVGNFLDTISPQNYHEATKLRWYPEDVGNLEVKYISRTTNESIATNESVGPGENPGFNFDFITGAPTGQADRMPNYGLTLQGVWWGVAADNVAPATWSWVTFDSVLAEGKRSDYYPPKRPRQQV